MTSTIAQWNAFELALSGPDDGNPFLDVELRAVFSLGNRTVSVPGFYDGDGTYRIRFMPDTEGDWRYITQSATTELHGHEGGFRCTPAEAGVHGPVRVHNRFHFAYADGTPYLPFGTTCYAWTHQPLEEQAKTLETLAKTRFNKIRMGIFPKSYMYNTNEPLHDVYVIGADGERDFDRPNPESFRHFESQVKALMELGIEADVIILHPYDRWGYCDMSAEQDYRYMKYLVARLAAYRNVWWSLANEYDFLLNSKPMEQWDRYFQIIEENDPCRHLTSIHNGDPAASYDHRKPWVDHVCIQHWDVKRTAEWRENYGKPVINDEPQYEGNVPQVWGNLHPRELVHRYWITLLRGGYCGHAESYAHPEDLIWWAKGGVLHGEAWPRIGFLRDLLEEDMDQGLTPMASTSHRTYVRIAAARDGKVRYIYFGEHQPVAWAIGLPEEDGDYEIDIIDTWAMTVTRVEKAPPPKTHPTRYGAVIRGGKPDAAFGVNLPGKPFLAVRIRQR